MPEGTVMLNVIVLREVVQVKMESVREEAEKT